ncbi:MAG: sensor N-terminal transmembrane domain-containing protein, partial [Alphaproteobacteria bacterium]
MPGGNLTADREDRRARAARRQKRRRWFSPLTRAMLLVNLIGPGVLLAGLLYLEGYEAELIESEIGVMKAQATLVAEALGESASREPDAKRDFEVALD